MVWALLAVLGVTIGICVLGISTLVLRVQRLQKRPRNIPLRALPARKKRWTSGNGIWVTNVFIWEGSLASWLGDMDEVVAATPRAPDRGERKKLHKLGDDPAVASLRFAGGGAVLVAARREDAAALMGPFATGDHSAG